MPCSHIVQAHTVMMHKIKHQQNRKLTKGRKGAIESGRAMGKGNEWKQNAMTHMHGNDRIKPSTLYVNLKTICKNL